MDKKTNLIFEKVWEDGDVIELKILAISEYVNVFQFCYVEKYFLNEVSTRILEYIKNKDKECYIEFGKKEGNFTPAFSMKFLASDNCGHVTIEVDLEIADNDSRRHRCCFYINSELGAIESFAKNIYMLSAKKIGATLNLNHFE